MTATPSPLSAASITPLGAGDLIDRAVRFYRRNFFTFILIAFPPVLAGTTLSLGWTYLSRSLFFTSGSFDPLESTAYVLFVWLGAMIIWFSETVVTLAVMGGASLNFVRHILFGENISVGETYRSTWRRLPGLLVAASIITLLLGFIGIFVFYFGLLSGALAVTLVAIALAPIPPLAVLVSLILGLAFAFGTYWLFCLVAARFAYVPQVIMVEGLGVFAAFSRSLSLASGNVKRFAALFAFTALAAYSALAVLYVPLGWYAWYQGVDIGGFSNTLTPAWYEIAAQIVWQASIVVLSPVWMIGLCLLYVDERVRHEGYDIELMAARRLGEIPDVPREYINPLQPAIGGRPRIEQRLPTSEPRPRITTLGLK